MAAEPLRLIVAGAAGRMGSRVAALASADPRFHVVARVFHQTPLENRGPAPITLQQVPERLSHADAVVDFSAPSSSVALAQACAQARKPVVIGTTGWKQADLARLKAVARKTAVFLAPNFSPAVSVFFHIAAQAARLLPGYEAGISEIHHSRKKDSPSGTALKLAEAVRAGRRNENPVPTASQRLGDVIGEHTLTLAGPFERLELTHRAHSRDVFARGALEAALWLRSRRVGLYGMPDLLGLE